MSVIFARNRGLGAEVRFDARHPPRKAILDKTAQAVSAGIMKWDELFSLRISELVLERLKNTKEIALKGEEETLRDRIARLIAGDFEREKELDREVQNLMDDLEKRGHSFERYKMFPLLKQKLAKKKGIVL